MFSGTVGKGVWGEAIVCADLTAKGYQVFWAIGGRAAFDLAVLVDPTTLKRVEVKSVTIQRLAGGGRDLKIGQHDPSVYDILAVVLPGGETHYIPSFDGLETIELYGQSNTQLRLRP